MLVYVCSSGIADSVIEKAYYILNRFNGNLDFLNWDSLFWQFDLLFRRRGFRDKSGSSEEAEK